MALLFDGSNDYINVLDSPDLTFGDGVNDSPFSILAWVNMTDATAFRIFNKIYSEGAPHLGEYLFNVDGGDKLRLSLLDDDTANRIDRFSNDVLTGDEDSWIFVGMTYDGVDIDGILLYRNAVSLVTTTFTLGTYVAMNASGKDVNIGSQYINGSRDTANGVIGEVSLWDKELTQPEIQSYMYKGLGGLAGFPGLVSCWPINDANSGVDILIKDLSGNENHGVMNGFAGNPWVGSPPVNLPRIAV